MNKKIVGISTIVVAIMYFVACFLLLKWELFYSGDTDAVSVTYMVSALVCTIVSVPMTFVFMVLFMFKVYKNLNMNERQKIVWYLLLYFGNLFVFPVFWYLYIYKRIDEKYPFYLERNKLWW